MLKIFNTLSRKIEKFKPLDEKNIRIYICGPTVYDSPHIGNARTMVIYDILYRVLSNLYPKVTYIRNITDVDDKINDRAQQLNIKIADLTRETTKIFHDDMQYLGCKNPTFEPKATEHITDMIEIIQILIEKGYAYITDDKHVYFNVSKYKDYHQLSHRSFETSLNTRKILRGEKQSEHDFVLWKPTLDQNFSSPWGSGRPGWHIECSAMSYKYLGSSFDIHCGGADLIFPHHTNEIAQSRCAFEEGIFAKYWMHSGFLTVAGEKMSKSLGNFITVQNLREKNIKGEVIRWALLNSSYSKPLDFSDKILHDAKQNLDYIYRAAENINNHVDDISELLEILKDDLNTTSALAFIYSLAKSGDSRLKSCANFLGFLNHESWFRSMEDIDDDIDKLVNDRLQAKKNNDWNKADSIRNQLLLRDVILEDTIDGKTKWRRK